MHTRLRQPLRRQLLHRFSRGSPRERMKIPTARKLVGVMVILPVLMGLGAVLAVCTVAELLGMDGAPDYA